MKNFDIQSIELHVAKNKAFTFIADPNNLPLWTNAFVSVSPGKAIMQTPGGKINIDLEVVESARSGCVDWQMIFPDLSVATAFSRIVEAENDRCIYSFILMPPPLPLEELEGALQTQSKILEEELKKLKGLLEQNG